jgi:protein tyrosine/serine phosphatase
VPNFGQVTDTLYRGGQPTAEGFEGLAHEGVGVVVDLSGNQSERDKVKKLGMEYVSIPWHCFHLEDKQVAQFLRVLREHSDQKVFVHCRLGEDRTGMMVAGYRMAEQGWTAEQARREMTAFGFSSMHHLMCPGLATYEENFPHRFQTNPAFDGLRPVQPSSQLQH